MDAAQCSAAAGISHQCTTALNDLDNNPAYSSALVDYMAANADCMAQCSGKTIPCTAVCSDGGAALIQACNALDGDSCGATQTMNNGQAHISFETCRPHGCTDTEMNIYGQCQGTQCGAGSQACPINYSDCGGISPLAAGFLVAFFLLLAMAALGWYFMRWKGLTLAELCGGMRECVSTCRLPGSSTGSGGGSGASAGERQSLTGGGSATAKSAGGTAGDGDGGGGGGNGGAAAASSAAGADAL